MKQRFVWAVVGFSVLGVMAGCRTNCSDRSPCGAPRAPWPGSPAADIPRAPFPPGAPSGTIIPPPPAPAPIAPAPVAPGPGAPAPGAPPNIQSSLAPPWATAQDWNPSASRVTVQLRPPQIIEQRQEPTTRFYGPAQVEPPAGLQASTTKPAPMNSPLPVGIPQFAVAKEGIGTGLRPLLDDGLDWLEANKYKAVLHLRLPAQDNSADRKQVEKRGMKYLSVEVSPETLSAAVVEEFNRLVSDPAHQPLYVYDQDGALAGTLWFLHFRSADSASDDSARSRAASLGLREDREGAHRAMWQAAQQLVKETR
jgi:protein tyrosine phosphatase (PTP) superfamily phosphohydrolase (DUF442 family)